MFYFLVFFFFFLLWIIFKVFIDFVTILLLLLSSDFLAKIMFWFFGHEACGILAPQLGTEPTPPALEGVNHWTTRDIPKVTEINSL